MTSEQLASRWNAVMMGNYATPKIEIVRGEGTRVWDREGNEYLDFIGGIATSSLGHAHPAIVQAITTQASQLIHSSNLYANDPSLTLAERLIELAGVPGKVFFSQDGATANEAALKLSRRHGGPERSEIIAMVGSFHGRTMGSLSLTGSPAKQDPFRPLLGGVTFVPHGDSDALEQACTMQTAAVIVEPVLGEAGVIIPPAGYLRDVRDICTASGALMIVDEVQSGFGRTGAWFESFSQGVTPDVVTLAKGIAGGMPLGACIGFGAAADLFVPGNHGSTFGGNPVSCAAALAVIDEIESRDVLENVRTTAALLASRLDQLDDRALVGFDYKGLWFGVEFADGLAPKFENCARTAGFLTNAVAPNRLRLAPPLNVSADEIEQFLDAIPEILVAVRSAD